jgi:hypothetical protein
MQSCMISMLITCSVGLNEKCLFPFSRKCENEQIFAKFHKISIHNHFLLSKKISYRYCFSERFRKNKKVRFLRKFSWKMCVYSRKFSRHALPHYWSKGSIKCSVAGLNKFCPDRKSLTRISVVVMAFIHTKVVKTVPYLNTSIGSKRSVSNRIRIRNTGWK